LFLPYGEEARASVDPKPFDKKGKKEMVRDPGSNQHSKDVKMKNSVLRSPVLWGFLILMFVSLWSTNLVWAAPDPSPLRQTVPTLYYVYLPLITKNYTPPAPLWRFGTAKGRQGFASYDSNGVASMRFGWYVDFIATANPSTPYGMEYVPTVRVKQDKLAGDGSTTDCRVGPYYKTPYSYTVSPSISQIQSIASSRPGMTWLIGNEMERVDWGDNGGKCNRQDEMLPELYAQAYHDIYTAIKGADPTAQVAIGGMVEFTLLRSQYLDRVWTEYTRLANLPENNWAEKTMPVDVWNTHLYVLPEVKGSWGADIPAGLSAASGALYTVLDNKDFAKAWAQIVSLRTWMKNHGQQNKPLIITEYGVNMPAWVNCDAYPNTSGCPFTPEQVRDSFMVPSFNAFLNQTDANIGYPSDGNRLVQRWNWWSADHDDGNCDNGVFTENYNGSLFYSGLGPSSPPTNCSFPAQGMSPLGTYWKQYVQNLPIGSTKPYAP
jgi:hypothetical protein